MFTIAAGIVLGFVGIILLLIFAGMVSSAIGNLRKAEVILIVSMIVVGCLTALYASQNPGTTRKPLTKIQIGPQGNQIGFDGTQWVDVKSGRAYWDGEVARPLEHQDAAKH